MPKVSIVIPIYNVKDYMSASVQSAVDQTEPEIEIILVDDGSTDGSQRLCDQYAEMDSRITVIHKVNGGLSSARNAGVAAAKAPYILLLDGDDYLHERAVERLLEVSLLYPSDIVQFQYTEVPEVVKLPDLMEVKVEVQANTAEEAFRYLYRWGGVCASGCTKLFRKKLLEKIPFESIRHEDEMWCTRAFPNDLTITYIPDVLYGYVMRPGSIIHSQFNRSRMDDVLKVKEERLKTLSMLGFSKVEALEWNQLFTTIFVLYREAKQADDKKSQDDIAVYLRRTIKLCKNGIRGRMKVFYYISRLNVQIALEIYSLYWSIRR
ncbi:glycosyltransferase family 2 protein [Pseudoflavonifractor sp. SW1122]|uniref:glycosyltransferase family 2 protein n=1 Tax=Pseudoflavonifractor sp. SW1122 TaxID=2530044 RepID=UPI00143AFFD5|nr:glycosyltransferase family 2 protein [Pseudoflavonifractor sp. SW1122]NJE73302.1 glycosyltransferase family 2 protein [Pseudoflavonifractor sp. SW1122]